MQEQWKLVAIPGATYEVSDLGRVRNSLTGRVLKPRITRDGYHYVTLTVGKEPKYCAIAHLVLEAFVGPRPHGCWARHFPDRNKSNNAALNLLWGTPKENSADREFHGTVPRGERNGAHTKPECVVRGPAHYKSRLSAGRMWQIEEMRRAGYSQQAIADETGFSQSYVSKILRGERHLVA